MSNAPVISKPLYHVLVLEPGGQMMAQCVVGPDDADQTLTLYVNVRPGLTPTEILPMVKIVGQAFTATTLGAENHGQPFDLENEGKLQ